MSSAWPRVGGVAAGVLIIASISGCIAGARVPAAATATVSTSIPRFRTPTPESPPTLLPASATSAAAPTTASPAAVQVKATGNLFIRRGPDVAFNPIAVLTRGQIAFPTGRDVLADWVRIPLPANPSQSGWVSVMTQFTEISGDLHSLTEIEPSEWPQLAFVRNCTYHQMILQPGGITVPSIIYFPDNDVRVNPGTYAVLDVDVDKYPRVSTLDIREGASLDIILDGDGSKKKCPVP